MPIILPKQYELSERESEISIVMSCIERAMTGVRAVALHNLAENILDEIDDARAFAEEEAQWPASLLEAPDEEERLTEAEEARLLAVRRTYLARRRAGFSKPPKPRIRVRAATERVA